MWARAYSFVIYSSNRVISEENKLFIIIIDIQEGRPEFGGVETCKKNKESAWNNIIPSSR